MARYGASHGLGFERVCAVGADDRAGDDPLDPDASDETPVRAADADLLEPDGGFWVFAYGSLMWKPGFDHDDRREATLDGFSRSFCLWSKRYRGTPEAPGLVLGLTRRADASTRGVAYRVAPEDAAEVRVYLAERELVSRAYHEIATPLRFTCSAGGATAIAYVIDPDHPQYAGSLSLAEQAEIIAARGGPMGPNCEYLFNTVAHLRELQVADAELDELERLVRTLQARA